MKIAPIQFVRNLTLKVFSCAKPQNRNISEEEERQLEYWSREATPEPVRHRLVQSPEKYR